MVVYLSIAGANAANAARGTGEALDEAVSPVELRDDVAGRQRLAHFAHAARCNVVGRASADSGVSALW